jgi:hypothetical protein
MKRGPDHDEMMLAQGDGRFDVLAFTHVARNVMLFCLGTLILQLDIVGALHRGSCRSSRAREKVAARVNIL